MRNLAAGLQVARIDLGGSDAPEDETVQAFCLGAGDGRLYCATDAAAVVCVSEADGKVRPHGGPR
jgi:hypothetical protein